MYQRAGDFENAVKAYEFAIRLDQEYVEYYCDLAGVYLREGYTKQAIDTLKRAKELAPGKPGVVLALGNAYSAGEHYSAAVKEYQELLEEAPDMEAAREQLAKALRAEGREEEARQVLLKSSAQIDLPDPRRF